MKNKKNQNIVYESKYARRFMVDAKEFLDTYRIIKNDKKKLNIKNLIICTSIELSLKSYLIKSKGTITKKEL